MTYIFVWIIGALTLCMIASIGAQAQMPIPKQFTLFDGEKVLWADGSRGPFPFSDRAIEQGSEQVWIDGIFWVRDRGYVADAKRAQITLLQDVSRGTKIVVRFRQSPQVIGEVMRHRVLKAPVTDGGAVIGSYTPPVSHAQNDEQKLVIGGHKSVAVTVGSHHAVNQALQLRIAGEVTEGIDLLAVLSDRNLPIGEQSSSRRLQELDRVFFQVSSSNVTATLGDLDVSLNGSVFGRYRRQLQGGYVSAQRDESQVRVFGAVSRGQWQTQRLVAVEGYQGPYRVSGGGLAGQLVPESERIYLNGQLLRRGDRLDYTVDYERGTITFAPEVIIGADSRITAEYQVVEDGRRSRLMGLETQLAVAEGFSLGTTLIRESDRPVLAGVATPGVAESQRQVGVLHAQYKPLPKMHVNGEVALSDRESGAGRAFRVDGGWGVANLDVTGRFRQVGANFEAFERLDWGDAAGRWGWQEDTVRTVRREGEVAVRYGWGDAFAVVGEYGRRSGAMNTDRKHVGIRLPVGNYRYESLGRGQGHMTRHDGKFEVLLGMVKPGFQFALENGLGDGVAGSSLFYAFGPQTLPQGINKQEVVWDVVVGEGGNWEWASELKYRRFQQRDVAWQDSLRGWSHTHRASLRNWKGWVFSGAYTQGKTRIGQAHKQNNHLGRVRLGHSRPGLSHQVTYRVSSTGVQSAKPVFVEVASGVGEYIWEDANGDGVQDPEEFIPDLDGNYVQVFDYRAGFEPARDGALGMRFEVDFRRLIGSDHWLSNVGFDASLRTDRQIATDSGSAAPWDLFGFDSGANILGGQRDALARLYLFRYSSLGSVRLTGRVHNQINRGFYGGAAEFGKEAGFLGKIRPRTQVELESEWNVGQRKREDAGSFAYDVNTVRGVLRSVVRPSQKWQLRLGILGGRDTDQVRELRVEYVGILPEFLYALPGRGRLRGRFDWTRVWAPEGTPLFLGLAQGNRPGQNWIWRLGVDYRFGKYVTAQLAYDGRKRPGRSTIHLGRMEMRATF